MFPLKKWKKSNIFKQTTNIFFFIWMNLVLMSPSSRLWRAFRFDASEGRCSRTFTEKADRLSCSDCISFARKQVEKI